MPWTAAAGSGAFAVADWRLEALESVLDHLGVAVTLIAPNYAQVNAPLAARGTPGRCQVLYRNRAADAAEAASQLEEHIAGSQAANSSAAGSGPSLCPRPLSCLVTHDLIFEVQRQAVNLCVSESVSPVDNPVVGTVMEASPHGTWVSLPMGEVEWSSSYIKEFTGFSAERALGHGWEQSIHPDDVAALRQAWQTALATGSFPDVEARMVVTGGGFHYFLFSCKALRDPETGAVLRWIGMMTDVNERRMLQDKLQAERALFLTAIDQLPVSVVVADAPSGAVRLANQRTFELWRISQLASSLEEYSQYTALRPDGRPFEPKDWPLARSILYGEVVTKEDVVFQRG